jgi:hypothetical protein
MYLTVILLQWLSLNNTNYRVPFFQNEKSETRQYNRDNTRVRWWPKGNTFGESRHYDNNSPLHFRKVTNSTMYCHLRSVTIVLSPSYCHHRTVVSSVSYNVRPVKHVHNEILKWMKLLTVGYSTMMKYHRTMRLTNETPPVSVKPQSH